MGPTPKYAKHPQTIMLAPPCFTVFTVYFGLYSVFGGRLTNCLQSSDPIRTILLSSVHRILCSSLWASQCVLWQTVTFSILFMRFLGNNLASQRDPLIVKVLTGKWRSSLISLELIIGCFFAILVILSSRQIPFSFSFPFQSIWNLFSWAANYFPLSNQLLIKVLSPPLQCLEQLILLTEQGLKPAGTTAAAFLP